MKELSDGSRFWEHTKHRAYRASRKLNHQIGKHLDSLGLAQQLTLRFGANWLWDILHGVDLGRVEKMVWAAQQKYPQASPAQISRHMVRQKLWYVSSWGLASGLIPGNLPMVALDIMAVLRVQAELVYAIALAHGFDLKDPARKAELLWVLGLGWGLDRVTVQYVTPAVTQRLGLYFAKSMATKFIPLIGAVLGAGTNATFLYVLGESGIKFYGEGGAEDREQA